MLDCQESMYEITKGVGNVGCIRLKAEFYDIIKAEMPCQAAPKQNLDNGIAQEIEESPSWKGEPDMASEHRETYVYTDKNGVEQSIRINGKNKRETDKKFQDFLRDGFQEVPTLREYVDENYRERYIKPLADTTQATYEQYLKLNILPFLGDMRINQIDTDMIQDFIQWMATASQRGRKADLNRKSIDRVLGLLSRIFSAAKAKKYVPENPVKKIVLRNTGKEAGHHKAIARDEMQRIREKIAFLDNERERMHMALLLLGIRPEEMCGLRWEDIQLDKGYCSIVRTVTYGKTKRTCVRDCGKSAAAIRTVIIPDLVAAILSTVKDKTGYLLYGRNKEEAISYSTFKRNYRSAFKKLGIEGKCNNYDFRTTFGTELCEAGLSSKQVGDMMGHADTRMVETVYARARHDGIMQNRDIVNHINQTMVVPDVTNTISVSA